MYRADYVKLHYVHYSTITVVSQMSEKETKSSGESWMHRYVERHMHEFDEEKEATMLHTKTKVARNMANWAARCKTGGFSETGCHLGFPIPKELIVKAGSKPMRDDGYRYTCYINEKIETYWWPKLVEAVKQRKAIAAPQ